MKFYYTLLYSIFLLSCFKIQGAELPSNYRLEFTTGHAKIDYVEKRNFGFNSTSAQSDTGLHTFLEWKYFLIPPIMDISLSADYTDGRFSSTNPHGRFRMLDVKSKVGFLLPLIYERFGIKLVGEFHYLKNLNTNDQFSLNSTSAYKFYPEFIFYPTGFQTDISYSFYIRRPLFQVDYEGSETLIGAAVSIPLNGRRAKYPVHAYQRALLIKVDYSDFDISFTTGGRSNTYSIKKLFLSLGLSI